MYQNLKLGFGTWHWRKEKINAILRIKYRIVCFFLEKKKWTIYSQCLFWTGKVCDLASTKKTCSSCLHANGQGNVVGAHNVLTRDSEDFMSCSFVVGVLAGQSPDYLSNFFKGINRTRWLISTLSFWNPLLIGWINWNNLASCSRTYSSGLSVSMNHNNPFK